MPAVLLKYSAEKRTCSLRNCDIRYLSGYFNQEIYIGKGIYDRKAFRTVLHNKVPENRILSHDLFESCYARTAFSSTARIMDNFPNSVLSFTKREHRWLRGDWQLVPWLFIGKTADGRSLSPYPGGKFLTFKKKSGSA